MVGTRSANVVGMNTQRTTTNTMDVTIWVEEWPATESREQAFRACLKSTTDVGFGRSAFASNPMEAVVKVIQSYSTFGP